VTVRRRHVRVPSVLQMEATECGAASLAMVLAHHGRHESLETLRVACGVARDGSTARNLVAAARGFGLRTRALRCDVDALMGLALPVIVHWRFNHFVVVEGRSRRGWYLNDPSGGPRLCSLDEFDESFTGVAIEMVPDQGFESSGARPGVLGRLWKAAGDTRGLPAFVIALAALLVVPTLLAPQLVRQFGNSLDGGGGLSAPTVVGGLVLAACTLAVVLVVQGSLAVRFATKVTARIGSSMVYRLLRLPASFHAQRGAAALAQRANLADQLSLGVSSLVVTAATGLLMTVVGTVALLALNFPVGLLAAGASVLTTASLYATVRRSRDQAARVVRESLEVGAVYASSLNQIEAIKAAGIEDGMIARGLAAQNRLLEANQGIGVRSLRLTVVPTLLSGLAVVVVAAATAWQVQTGLIDPGSFVAVLALTAVVIAPLHQVVASLDGAQTLRATLDQIADVFDSDEDPELVNVASGEVPAVLRGELELKSVTFGYSPRSQPVIADVDLHLRPGQRVALVGPSGCGKSTVSRLVTGLYAPWTGQVLVDGRARSGHAHEVLADQVALVDQDVTVFCGTVRDNVTLWDPSVDDAEVIAALDDAQLGAEVARRPGGLDAELAEGGADLSGGQRQRLEIARALVRNPAIVVLDEATSSLDPVTERRIDEALRRRGITCLVIAHRLSTVRDCDQIVVLDAGRVVQRGTHDELMQRGGTYVELVQSS